MKPAPPPGKWRHEIITDGYRRNKASTIQAELNRRLRDNKDSFNEESTK